MKVPYRFNSLPVPRSIWREEEFHNISFVLISSAQIIHGFLGILSNIFEKNDILQFLIFDEISKRGYFENFMNLEKSEKFEEKKN